MNRIRRFIFAACVVASAGRAHAGNQSVRINEVMAGLNADSGIQFVELAVRDQAQKQWGPRGAESAGRCELVFTNSAGVPSLAKLAIMDSQSLRRVAHFDATSFGSGGQLNADFALGTPTPASTRETFLGNGQTCASCHPQSQRFSLPSARVTALPFDDPLFVMDANVNTLVLGGATQMFYRARTAP